MGEERISQSHKALWWSCVVSVILFVVFAWLQVSRSAVMELKAQWLWLAIVPILIVLITGKYIGKLKGPGIEFEAYKSDSQMRQLPSTPPQAPTGLGEAPPAVSAAALPSVATGAPAASDDDWILARKSEYERTNRLFLVHVYEPSTIPAQKYDITIFLMRHIPGSTPNQRDGFLEVEKLELCFGPAWGNEIFTAGNNGGLIGVRTSAWGSFLATGRVIFKDRRPPVILHRYIDFEMAPKKVV
jgi:hypothetical protein